MDIKTRITAMTADLPALTIGELVRYGRSVHGHRSSFHVDVAGRSLAVVSVDPAAGATDAQAQVDELALALHALITGSEGRVADAEQRAENLRRALAEHKKTIGGLKNQLADFEAGRTGQGDMYAIETPANTVWLCGKPDASAFGLHFASWGDLARAFPGLRPAGVRDGYVIMRPIGDMTEPP